MIAALVIAALVIVLLYAHFKKPSVDLAYMPPALTVLRDDLLFGYFHRFKSQISETRDHINWVFESGVAWNGLADTIASIADHGLPTMLMLTGECYIADKTPQPDVFDRCCATFSALKTAGVLNKVKWLYPIDEPDLDGRISDETATLVNLEVLRAAATFQELDKAVLACTFTGTGNIFPGISLCGLVFLDGYNLRSGILISDVFMRMLDRLKPWQRYGLMPCGADSFRQDPEAFRRFAHSDQRCVGILAFMWEKLLPSDVLGIRDNGMADAYRAVGKEFTHRQ